MKLVKSYRFFIPLKKGARDMPGGTSFHPSFSFSVLRDCLTKIYRWIIYSQKHFVSIIDINTFVSMKNNIRPDAFITTILDSITLDTTAPSLKVMFEEEYNEQIQRLWNEFLIHEKIKAYARTHPLLMEPIERTQLSVRAKNALRAADVEIVADITLYSPSELRMLRNLGEKTVKEIERLANDAVK